MRYNFTAVENLYFARMIYPVAKRAENNDLTNLTININSEHIQHDEVGDTRNYTEQNNLYSYRVSYKAYTTTSI